MYFNLAKKNMVKNIRDYMLYFITVVIIIGIFFAFSSEDIPVYILGIMGGATQNIRAEMKELMDAISIFIMIGFAIIIIYSNSFFIKRRKNEIGVCLSLGMSKNRIAGVLFLESLLIVIIALIIGIAGGVVLSQVMMVGVFHMMGIGFANYKFIFSVSALFKTIIYFIVVFIIVGIINMSFAGMKISDSLSSKNKESFLMQKKISTSIITFIIGLLGIMLSYWILFWMMGPTVILSLISGIISIIVFMIGLVNLIIHVICKNEKLFFKGINIFAVRQMKINGSKLIITSIITSVLLLISMVGFILTMNTSATIFLSNHNSREIYMNDITPGIDANIYNNIGIDNVKSLNYIMKNSGASQKYNYDLSEKAIITGNLNIVGENGSETYNRFNIVSLKWYNKYMEMIGGVQDKLSPNEAIIIANTNSDLKLFERAGRNKQFKFAGTTYKVTKEKLVKNNNGIMYQEGIPTIILPVKIQSKDDGSKVLITQENKKINLEKYLTFSIPILSINAKVAKYNTVAAYGNLTNTLNKFVNNKNFKKVLEQNAQLNISRDYSNFTISSHVAEQQNMMQSKVVYTFTWIYISAIFLIGSALLLTLQIFIETTEEKERYKTLKNIGVSKTQISANVLKQVIIRFGIPFIFAGVNIILMAICFTSMNILGQDFKVVIITLIVSMLIYILYGVITYIKAKKIANE